MSHELHYTSAPQGLKAGSIGYSTVGATANLPAPLADRLEGLSAFRAVYPASETSASRNPWVISHYPVRFASFSYNVLSRISDAGLDYSRRDNKYAHHIAIEARERPEAGPAWLASQSGFLDRAWSGEPRVFPSGRPVPRGEFKGGVCRTWEKWFDDSGWAGVIAESFLADPERPITILFNPGEDVLPLFVEALALLPRDRRWDVGFSTYFTGQLQGLTCVWRGVLRGSPEEPQARKVPGALILDAENKPGLAPEGPLVNQARTGIAPPEAERPAFRPSGGLATPIRPQNSPRRVSPNQGRYYIGEERDGAAPNISNPAGPSPAQRQFAAQKRKQKMLMAWVGIAAGIILGLTGFMTWQIVGSINEDRRIEGLFSELVSNIDNKKWKEARKIVESNSDELRTKDKDRLESQKKKLENGEFAIQTKAMLLSLEVSVKDTDPDEPEPEEFKALEKRSLTDQERASLNKIKKDRGRIIQQKRLNRLETAFETSIRENDISKANQDYQKIEESGMKAEQDLKQLANRITELENQESGRVKAFNLAMEQAEWEIYNLNGENPEQRSKRITGLEAATQLQRTESEKRQVLGLTSGTALENHRVIPPTPPNPLTASSPTPPTTVDFRPIAAQPQKPVELALPEKASTPVDEKSPLHLESFALPPARTEPALRSARTEKDQRPPSSFQSKTFSSPDWVIAQLEIIGLKELGEKLPGKLEPKSEPPVNNLKQLSIIYTSTKPDRKPVSLGSFSWDKNYLEFKRSSELFKTDENQAYETLNTCVLKVIPRQGEPVFFWMREPLELQAKTVIPIRMRSIFNQRNLFQEYKIVMKAGQSLGFMKPFLGNYSLSNKSDRSTLMATINSSLSSTLQNEIDNRGSTISVLLVAGSINTNLLLKLSLVVKDDQMTFVVLPSKNDNSKNWEMVWKAVELHNQSSRGSKITKLKDFIVWLSETNAEKYYPKQVLDERGVMIENPKHREAIYAFKSMNMILHFLDESDLDYRVYSKLEGRTFELPISVAPEPVKNPG